MLNKSPSLRPSAAEVLKVPYIDEQLQVLEMRVVFPGLTFCVLKLCCRTEMWLRIGQKGGKQALSEAKWNTGKISLQRRLDKLWLPDATRHGELEL